MSSNNTTDDNEFENSAMIINSQSPPNDSIIKYWQLKNIKANLIPPKSRITRNVLSLYERTRILSERTEQLRHGAQPKIDPKKHNVINNNSYYESIAEIELKKKLIPVKIRRYLHNNKYEEWSLDELAQLSY